MLRLARAVPVRATLRLDCVLIDAGLLSGGRGRGGTRNARARARGAARASTRRSSPGASDPAASAGDRALAVVAVTLRAATRDYDVAARFGGDEFTIVLPETGTPGALVVAERIRTGVERGAEELGFELTVSIGVSTTTERETTAEGLLTLADRAAYRAKFSGRNAVALPPEGDPVEEAERLLAGVE